MADVKKIKMTSQVLTSKEIVHSKEYRIRPQGIHSFLCAKQFSGITLVEKAIFMEYQEIQLQMLSCFMLKLLSFQKQKKRILCCFTATLWYCLICLLKKHTT